MMVSHQMHLPASPSIREAQFIRISGGAITLGLILIGGCASPMCYRGEPAPQTWAAPREGMYKLYRHCDGLPLLCIALGRGEPVGFGRDSDDRLVAVAGDYKQAIVEGRYKWVWAGNGDSELGQAVAPLLLVVGVITYICAPKAGPPAWSTGRGI